MFGLEFLFSAALFALPLAALPLILHLLHRRKSTIVEVPTLRFIQSALQQTAARRKVQRWLLLAIRMLLLALLIWAVAQPARILASRFFSSAGDSVAAIVVDTSWSMQYRNDQLPLLDHAQQIVQSLLRDQLSESSVVLVTGDGEQGTFRPSAELLTQWTPLEYSASATPLADRVLAAAEMLSQNPASEKLLVVISDFQSRDFPRPLPKLSDDLRVVAIDLRPEQPRSAGVQRISLSPAQPIAGLGARVEVELAGPPSDLRPVSLEVAIVDGRQLLQRPPVMASFDDFGHAVVHFDLEMPAERWQIITARIDGEDPMPWDDRRQLAVEIPQQQRVIVLDGSDTTAQARRLVTLALDPQEGRLGSWPLRVENGRSISGHNAVVAILDALPDAPTAQAWTNHVNAGGTLVLMLKPGIEAAWHGPASEALEKLLPSRPFAADHGKVLRFAPAAAARQDASMADLLSNAAVLEGLRAARIVHMAVEDQRSTGLLIASMAGDERASVDRSGLLYLKRVGAGRVFTWSCIPDGVNTNLGTHPMFLPLLVNQCLRPLHTSFAGNAQVGELLSWPHARQQREMELHTPGGAAYRLPVSDGKATYTATEPGIYTWHVPGEQELRGLVNVSAPGAESQTSYRPAETLLPDGPNVLVARSLDELHSRIAEVSQPQPRWTVPLAMALLLLCFEGLISTESGPWSWLKR